MLFTVLGEYVREPGRELWTTTLVAALGRVGIEESNARQALTRTARSGWIEQVRCGRRLRWRLTERARLHLAESAEEIYTRRRQPRSWNGEWVLVVATVPEIRRDLRHRLRNRFRWAGFGPFGQGVWISPRVEAEEEARRALTSLGLEANALSLVGRISALGSEYEVINRAWALGALDRDYNGFRVDFGAAETLDEGRDPGDTFAELTRMVHRWREFALRDPILPAELLPARWSGHAASELFYRRHDSLMATAQQWLDSVDDSERPIRR